MRNFCFQPWWSAWYHTSPPTVNNYKTGQHIWSNYFQSVDNRQCTTVIPERRETHWANPFWPSSLSGDNFLTRAQRAGGYVVHIGHNELRWEFEAAEVSGIYGEKHWTRREVCRKRVPGFIWGASHEFMVMGWTTHLQSEITWGLPDSAKTLM